MKLYNKITLTYHIVESVETIEGKNYFFTEDTKCFPEDNVHLCTHLSSSNSILKILNNENLNKTEEEKLNIELSSLNFVKIDSEKIKLQTDKFLKKKKYGFFSFLF